MSCTAWDDDGCRDGIVELSSAQSFPSSGSPPLQSVAASATVLADGWDSSADSGLGKAPY